MNEEHKQELKNQQEKHDQEIAELKEEIKQMQKEFNKISKHQIREKTKTQIKEYINQETIKGNIKPNQQKIITDLAITQTDLNTFIATPENIKNLIKNTKATLILNPEITKQIEEIKQKETEKKSKTTLRNQA